MDPSLWELFEAGDEGDEVAAIIRLGQPGAAPPGVRLVAQFGDIATCRVRRGALLDIRAQAEVTSLKAPRLLVPEDDVDPGLPIEEFEACYTWSDQRRPEGLAYTGQGIVVGVVDWGLDFAHPDFRNEDGTTRLLALWDQRQPGSLSVPYGYGLIYGREDINRALAAANPYTALGYHPADADPGRGAHGTHIMSIAAGNGRGGGPSGIAPEADLVFVHMASMAQQVSARLGDSASLLEAIDFIARQAASQSPAAISTTLQQFPAPLSDSGPGRPWVANLSMGRHSQQHDGTTLVEQALDAVLRAAPGRAIVQSAGNYYQRCIHASGQLRPGEERRLIWQLSEADLVPNELEIWYSGRDVMTIRVRSPSGAGVCQVDLGERTSVVVDGQHVGSIYNRAHEPNNLDNQVQIVLYRSAPAGDWEVTIQARDVVDGRYHCWIEREPTRPTEQSSFHLEDAESTGTTGTICNGLRTIAVGAYNAHSPAEEVASFSSSGPTRDGRIKPDMCAPGVYVLAARSAPRDTGGEPPPLLTRFSGTSMACPHVAGTVALMFQASPRPLRIEETRNLLLASTRKAPDQENLLCRVGSGYLDIEKAVASVQNIRGVGPYPRQAAETIPAGDILNAERSQPPEQEVMRSELEAVRMRPDSEHVEEVDTMSIPTQDEVVSERTSFEQPEGEDTGDYQADDDSIYEIDEPVLEIDPLFESDFPQVETPDHTPVYQFQATSTGLDGGLTGSAYEAGPAYSDVECDSEAFLETNIDLIEMADELTVDFRLGHNSRVFFHETLSRAGVTDKLLAVEPTQLYDTFVYSRYPGLMSRLEQIFEVVALPLEVLDQPLQTGDILVRRSEGGLAHLAFIARPECIPLERLQRQGLTPEVYRPGEYVQVVEGGARPHRLADHFARRLSEPGGRLPYNQLILRVHLYHPGAR